MYEADPHVDITQPKSPREKSAEELLTALEKVLSKTSYSCFSTDSKKMLDEFTEKEL